MSLLDQLVGQLGDSNMKTISKTIGTDETKTQSAIAAALPLLMGALSRNASKPEGAEALAGALVRDHDGSIFDNMDDLLNNPESGQGDGILRHTLGEKRARMENGVSKMSGIDAASAGKLMMTLAPLVMGMLGKQKRQQNLDTNGLAGMLNQERSTQEQGLPQMAMVSKLLDTDGDGDVDLGDLAGGAGMLGKLFGGR